uniref:Uncharacterized protein n=2 Tax=Zea mays TaxID=4577 RepID=C0PHY2_MAIZE|nr:unknown [Zea mays]
MVSALLPLLVIVLFFPKSSAPIRINTGLTLFTLTLVLVPAMDLIYVKGRAGLYGAFDVTVAATALCGVADALVQGGVIGFAGELPERYMQAVVAGTAASVHISAWTSFCRSACLGTESLHQGTVPTGRERAKAKRDPLLRGRHSPHGHLHRVLQRGGQAPGRDILQEHEEEGAESGGRRRHDGPRVEVDAVEHRRDREVVRDRSGAHLRRHALHLPRVHHGGRALRGARGLVPHHPHHRLQRVRPRRQGPARCLPPPEWQRRHRGVLCEAPVLPALLRLPARAELFPHRDPRHRADVPPGAH